MSGGGTKLRFLFENDEADDWHRWDDDVVFKNQARGTEDKRKKEFVNVGLFGSELPFCRALLTVQCRTCYVRIFISVSW